MYIGCTHNNMHTRESNRNRKFRQLQKDAIIDAELSSRWWRKHHNYHQYTPLVIQHNIPSQHLEAQEHTFIQHFQPKLNFPRIAPHMKQAFRGISQPARNTIPSRSGLMSIWAKLRRKHLPPAIQPLHKSPTFQRQSQVWQTICNLASNTKRRFDSTRELLKTSTPTARLYALHKLSSNLPATHQRPTTKAIGTAELAPNSRLPAKLSYLDTQNNAPTRPNTSDNASHYTNNTPFHYTLRPQLSYSLGTLESKTSCTTGENSTEHGNHTTRLSVPANSSTTNTRTTFTTNTWCYRCTSSHQINTSYSILAEAHSSLPQTNSDKHCFAPYNDGTSNITSPFQHHKTRRPQHSSNSNSSNTINIHKSFSTST